MLRPVFLSSFLLVAVLTVSAQDGAKLLGVWKLVSFDTEFQATGERKQIYGKNPTGYLILTAEGRMMTLITGEGRKPAETDQDQAALLRTMFAYTGIYRIEADRFITKVDASWNEAWTGTDQVRFYKLIGNRLEVVSAWAPSASLPGRPIVRGVVTFERTR